MYTMFLNISCEIRNKWILYEIIRQCIKTFYLVLPMGHSIYNKILLNSYSSSTVQSKLINDLSLVYFLFIITCLYFLRKVILVYVSIGEQKYNRGPWFIVTSWHWHCFSFWMRQKNNEQYFFALVVYIAFRR